MKAPRNKIVKISLYICVYSIQLEIDIHTSFYFSQWNRSRIQIGPFSSISYIYTRIYIFTYIYIHTCTFSFFLQNVFPVLFDMKKFNYFFSSFLGFIPGFFIFNTIGSGLNTYIKGNETFSLLSLISAPEIYFPILMFVGLIVLSLLVKKKYF